MDLSKKCIKCESNNNLNTFINMNIKNYECKIAICDDHVKEMLGNLITIVNEYIQEYEDLLDKARKFGMNISKECNKKAINNSECNTPIKHDNIQKINDNVQVVKAIDDDIQIVKTTNDAIKSVTEDVIKSDKSYKEIYNNVAVKCTLCRGSGLNRINNKTCIKCNGKGFIEK